MMRALWRNYNLSIVLFALFMASWILQGVAQWFEVAHDARAHGQASSFTDFWPVFLSATFENWQSEFLQLLSFVVLTSFLIHKGSHESKDADEEMQATLGRIETRLRRLERGVVWTRIATGGSGNDTDSRQDGSGDHENGYDPSGHVDAADVDAHVNVAGHAVGVVTSGR
jgi:hypothetical protein